jgi:hypothetical protein
LSSRGHYVGQVIDDLDAIASQVRQRCLLGQTDLNRVLEDFFKEVLNLAHGFNLQNLNKDRMNAPGLDLGDGSAGAKVAYQITSQAGAKKVNDTLRKISTKHLATYDRFYVLIIGQRQASYTLDAGLVKKCRFDETNILGITELCRDIMDLDLSTLQAVHRKIADEQRRIRIELEPELPDGSFQTSVMQSIEPKPSVTRSDATIFAAHPDVEGLFEDADDARKPLDALIDELGRLPRLTREFLGWMTDESDQKQGIGSEGLEVNADYLDSMCRNMTNVMAEIRLLEARRFIDFEQDESHKSGRFRIFFPGTQGTNFREGFIYFTKAEGLNVRTLFSTMNFSPFGPAPVMPSAPVEAAAAKPSRKFSKKFKRPAATKRLKRHRK